MPAKVCPQCGAEYELNQKFCTHDGAVLRGGEVEGLVGRIIDGREVQRRLGEGGMGEVYLAQYINLKRKDALKVMRPEFSRNADAVSRFRREAMNASRLNHPNVATIYAVGDTEDGMPYMAMEFIEGPSLAEILKELTSLPAVRAVDMVKQIASALQAAHDLGIVHRDLKPENVMVAHRPAPDTVKLVDFGISKVSDAADQQVTATGIAIGSPAYMSPEQVNGQSVDPRSDLYSLGLVAFKLLTGKLPFVGEGHELMLARLTDTPLTLERVRGDIPWGQELESVMARSLSRDTNKRYQTAGDFAREFDRGVRAMPLAGNSADATVTFQNPLSPPTPVPMPLAGGRPAGIGVMPATVETPHPPTRESPVRPGRGWAPFAAIGGGVALVAVAAFAWKSQSAGHPSGAEAAKPPGPATSTPGDDVKPVIQVGTTQPPSSGADKPVGNGGGSTGQRDGGSTKATGSSTGAAGDAPPPKPKTIAFTTPHLRVRTLGVPPALRARVDSVINFLSKNPVTGGVAVVASAQGAADITLSGDSSGKLVVKGRDGRTRIVPPETITKPAGLGWAIHYEVATLDLAGLDAQATSGDVTVQFAGGKSELSNGDKLTLKVKSARGGFLTIVDIAPNGKVRAFMPLDHGNPKALAPGQEITWPSGDEPFTAEEKQGPALLRVIVTENPVALPRASSLDDQVAIQVRNGVETMVKAGKSPWSTATLPYVIR